MTISGRLSESLSCATESVEPRSPLGLTRSGRPVWPIFGAQPPDDDDDDQDDLDDDDDEDDEDSGTRKSKKKSDEDKDKDDDEDDALAEANARAARYKKRMQAADRRNADLTARVAALEKGGDKDKDKDAEPSEELVQTKKEVEALREANSALRVENSFHLNNKFTWHDPRDVLALVLKDEDVEVDEDGNVEGMEAALKRIAKNKPWLIKEANSTRDDDDDEDDDDEEDDDRPAARRRRTPSGGAQNGRRGTKGADRAQLVQTYPALNRR